MQTEQESMIEQILDGCEKSPPTGREFNSFLRDEALREKNEATIAVLEAADELASEDIDTVTPSVDDDPWSDGIRSSEWCKESYRVRYWLNAGFDAWGDVRFDELLKRSRLRSLNAEQIRMAKDAYMERFLSCAMNGY